MDLFECEACEFSCATKSGIRKHYLERNTKACLEIVLRSKDKKSLEPTFESLPVRPPSTWRSYTEAVISASGETTSGELNQLKTLYFSEQLGKCPIGISVDGTELNAMVNRDVFTALPDKPFLAIVNKSAVHSDIKPRWEIQQCLNCNPPPVPVIGDLIDNTVYSSVIGTRTFKELTPGTCRRLNLNWLRYPQARQIACHTLSGAILYNIKNGNMLLINEVEAYGRSKMVDCHREQVGLIKDVPMATSMPSTLGADHYRGIHPVTLPKKDCKRLVIGTFTCDVLVTSCVRLDVVNSASISVGADTLNFEILEQDSRHIRIFVDSERVKAARKMVNQSLEEVNNNMGVEHLRQLRTKFDQLDTYDLSRCSGPLTASPLYQPYTLFTVANFGTGQGAAFAGAYIFNKIGQAVIIRGEKATLFETDVKGCIKMCQSSQEFQIPFKTIHDLFLDDKKDIKILGNVALNKQLELLAQSLSRRISEANKKVTVEIQNLFATTSSSRP
ncbi:hypothetical protein BGX28_000388 [Mortierella sp. GBA30]|nr:hypothetical protein BGX28_000388 [Mortierella sp. GBA30]